MSRITSTPAPASLRRLAVGGALCATLALAGCSVAYDPAAPAGPGTAPAHSQTPPSTPDTDGDSPMTRAAYSGLVERTLSCPDGELDVDAVGDIVALDGDCDTLDVSGTGAVVLAQGIGALHVTGSANIVIVATAGSIDVTGTSNEIVWESGSPTTTDTGTANRLGPSKGE